MTALLITSILELFVLISIVSNLLLLKASWLMLTYGMPESVDLPIMIFLKEDFYIGVVIFIAGSSPTMIQRSLNFKIMTRSLFLSKRGLLSLCLVLDLEKNYESPYVLNLTIVL